MLVRLRCNIKISRVSGKIISFASVNNVEIERSVYDLGSTCKIRIPASCRLRREGKYISDSLQTAKQFERGDKIEVSLGYGNNTRVEFVGFIYRINYVIPVEIECEGFEYLLRKPCETKTWENTSLSEVFSYILSGTTVNDWSICTSTIPSLELSNYVIPAGTTRLEALQDLKDKCSLTMFFNENALFVGLNDLPDFGTVKYTLGVNTIKDNQLKFRNSDDVKVLIRAIMVNKDNTKLEANIGDKGGQVRTLFFYNISSKVDLENIARKELEKYKYSGYEGKVTAFLQPFAIPGMSVKLTDPVYDERNGRFFITSTKVEFGLQGGRRTVELGIKI